MYKILRNHIESIVPLTDEEYTLVSSYFKAKVFKKHQFMVTEGELVPYNYYLVSGLTKLVYTDLSAKQHILAFAMEDWWDSDYQAYFTQTKATLSLECLEDTAALCITLNEYHELCNALPKMERFFLQKVTRGFLASQRRILTLLTASVQERYEQLIVQQPALLQRVPKTQIAAYLGVSREALSRLGSK